MKIKSVTISGMHHVTNRKYTFDDINYLHGPNGAGKSTVLEAIQLAVLGYIPGTSKQISAIFQHASAPEMRIRLDFEDGRYVERKWHTKGRSIESKLSGDFDADSLSAVIGDLELPIFNFNELMSLTANKLKDWFINFLPSASADIDWQQELLNSLDGIGIMDETLMPAALKDLTCEDLGVLERLQAFNAQLKDKQSYMKTELKRSEATIQSLIFYDDADLNGSKEFLEGEITRCQTEIAALTTEKEQLIRAMQIISSNNNVRSQLKNIEEGDVINIADLQGKIFDINQQIGTLQTEISQLETKLNEVMQKGFSLDADIRAKEDIIRSQGICPYTRTTCDSIITMIEEFRQQVANLQKDRVSISDEVNSIRSEIDQKKRQITSLNADVSRYSTEMTRGQSLESTVTRLNSLLVAEPDITMFKDPQWYTDEIAQLNQRITKIRANQRYSSLIDSLTAEKYRIENTIEVYKCWIKLTDPNGLQTRVMDGPFRALAEDMDKYLSIMFTDNVGCRFNLEQRTNSFSFGILRNGRYIPYDLLSSGEKTMYTLALMLCIIHRSSSSLKLLIVDDILDHLDNSRADEVFDSIGKISDIQVIIAGVKDSPNASSYTIEVN